MPRFDLTDEAILLLLGEGARTWRLAARFGWKTPEMRARLKGLEARGKVARSERYSYPNDIYWVPVARADDSPDDKQAKA